MKICENCKKEIKGKYIIMKSVEKEDYGREFYLCPKCLKDWYAPIEKN